MSGLLLSLLVGLGLFVAGAGFTVASNASVMTGFLAARICFVISIIIVAGAFSIWAWSSQLSVPPKALMLGIIGASTIPALFLMIVWADDLEATRLKRLLPGTYPDPPAPVGCEAEAGAFKVFLGSNMAWATNFPHTVLQMRGEDMLTIDKDKKGNLVIALLRIFDDQQVITVKFEDGDYQTGDGVLVKKTDKSTLIVNNKSDIEVLRIRHLNRESVEITGMFHNAGAAPIVVEKSRVRMGGMLLAENCLGNNRVDLSSG